MSYEEKVIKRTDMAGNNRKSQTNYNSEIDQAKSARDNQLKDTDEMVEKEGFLGVDDLDKMRRRKIR